MAALAAVFLVLPQTGADATITVAEVAGGAWTYAPDELVIEAGQRVAFTNETETTHTADCIDCPWSTGDIQPGQTKMVVFDEDLASTFVCRYHSEVLVGSLTVGTPPAPDATPSPGSEGVEPGSTTTPAPTPVAT